MENNWPETIDELLDECQLLINKYDLYTLGEHGGFVCRFPSRKAEVVGESDADDGRQDGW